MRERKSDRLLAVVDLGSNSFRLEIGRVEGDQIYQLDTWRETLRFGAGVDQKGRLTQSAMKAALACLARFRERLSGLHPAAVRVVATNTFRVAKNAEEFVALAERTLGLPIDVISGHEEARLTYFGVAHELPRSLEPRLVIDIGGGSTELIIGRGLQAERLESLTIGCVGMTQRFFAGGAISAAAMKAAETVARVEIEAVARGFAPGHWRDAYASSGTAMAIADILEQNAFSPAGITPTGLARLRQRMAQRSVIPGCPIRTPRKVRNRFRRMRLEEHELQKMILVTSVGRDVERAARCDAVLPSFVHGALRRNLGNSPVDRRMFDRGCSLSFGSMPGRGAVASNKCMATRKMSRRSRAHASRSSLVVMRLSLGLGTGPEVAKASFRE